MRVQDLAGWFPVDISWEANPPVVEWSYLGTTPFEEPFFSDTVERAAESNPDRKPLRTPITILEQFEEEQAGDTPTGFLFHMSRCGSTLASRLLASTRRSLVLSEPGAVNKVLGAPRSVPWAMKTRWFKGLVKALDQRRQRSQEFFWIKFSGWNVTESAFLTSIYPDVPSCFLFRDPVEVMVSLLDDSPGWLGVILDLEKNRQSATGIPPRSAEECCAQLLAHFCRSALKTPGDAMRFVDYRSLPGSIWGTMASHFGVSFTPTELERMGEVAKVHAKDIQGIRTFTGDVALKQEKASDLVRSMAAKWVGEPFAELERRARDFESGSNGT